MSAARSQQAYRFAIPPKGALWDALLPIVLLEHQSILPSFQRKSRSFVY